MIVRWAEIQLRNEDPYPLVIFLQFAWFFNGPWLVPWFPYQW